MVFQKLDMTSAASSPHNSQSTEWPGRARKLSRLLAPPNVTFRTVHLHCSEVQFTRSPAAEALRPEAVRPASRNGRHFSFDRQREAEYRAVSGLALGPDMPAVRFHNLAAGGESD